MTAGGAYEHDPGCDYAREGRGAHSDAAKRVADTYMLHRTAGKALGLENVGKVFAVSLQDGTSDGVLYDDVKDAIRHQRHNARAYAYLRVGREGMTPCNAASIMKLHREVDAHSGLNFIDRDDPLFGGEVIPRLTVEDHQRMTGAAAAGTWIPGRTLR